MEAGVANHVWSVEEIVGLRGLTTRRNTMKSKLKKIALHTILFVAALVIISAVAIWLGLGPVAHSLAISN
jgi:hypothetical protein